MIIAGRNQDVARGGGKPVAGKFEGVAEDQHGKDLRCRPRPASGQCEEQVEAAEGFYRDDDQHDHHGWAQMRQRHMEEAF